MSLFSVVNIFLLTCFFPCFFFYHPLLLVIVLVLWGVLFYIYVVPDIVTIHVSRPWAFVLFLVSEAIIFGTLLICCFWFRKTRSQPLALYDEVPFVETILLLISSVKITGFHMYLGKKKELSDDFLKASILAAGVFVLFALYEAMNCLVCGPSNPHASCCYIVVGLHLMHVFIGCLGLCSLYKAGNTALVRHMTKMIVFYWHFVDVIWMFVYTVVYVMY